MKFDGIKLAQAYLMGIPVACTIIMFVAIFWSMINNWAVVSFNFNYFGEGIAELIIIGLCILIWILFVLNSMILLAYKWLRRESLKKQATEITEWIKHEYPDNKKAKQRKTKARAKGKRVSRQPKRVRRA